MKRSLKKRVDAVKSLKNDIRWSWILVGVIAFASPGFAQGLAFPRVAQVSSVDEINENYWPYLKFVVEVGKQTDPQNTKRLMSIYQSLAKRSPEGAARFLKGLRFEMMQKLEFSNISATSVSTQSPIMRKFVAKYMSEWVREADEYLFRSYTGNLAKRD